ncbi:hypothetical protein [Pseudomonas sp.]|uniref:hypothetical protein n=1 Tax=Pseudomonas sp. TaxID=306 RepID=UPI003FD88969
MAVPAGPTDKRYTGNGVTKTFTIPFLLLSATDLDVFINGVEVVSGFTVTGVGSPTSSITFSAAPASLSDILLTLNVPFERLNDYQENGDFLSSTVNRDFDRVWQALKQLLRYSTRALSLGFFDVDGAGAYRAKGNRIADLSNPVADQDAATKRSVEQYVGAVIASGQGSMNIASNVVYALPGAGVGTLQQLSVTNDPSRGAAMIGRATVAVESIAELMLVPTDSKCHVSTSSYHAGLNMGGRLFYFAPAVAKSNHNGGNIIDPSKTFPTAWDTDAIFADWFTGTNPGNGCWVSINQNVLFVEDFGAKGNNDPAAGTGADDTIPINKAAYSLRHVFDGWVRSPGNEYYDSSSLDGVCAELGFGRGFFKTTGKINLPRGIKVTGANAKNHGGTRIKKYGVDGAPVIDCYGIQTSNGQYIADQFISNLFISNQLGNGIQALKPVGTTDFYSPGSLSFDHLFFLDFPGSSTTTYAAIDADSVERATNITFDAMENCGMRVGTVQLYTGIIHFFNRGGLVFVPSRAASPAVPSTIGVVSFIGCGAGTAEFGEAYQGAIGFLGKPRVSGAIVSTASNITASCITIAASGSAGIHGIISQNCIVKDSFISAKCFGLRGDAVRIDRTNGGSISIKARDCGASSAGVYTVAVLESAVDTEFNLDIKRSDPSTSANFYLGAGSTGNYGSLRQSTNRVIMPAGAFRSINDTASDNFPALIRTGPATGWANPTYVNSWAANSSNPLKFRRDELGRTCFDGRMLGGPFNVLAFTLPVGMWPAAGRTLEFIVPAGGGANTFGTVLINGNGEVYLASSSNSSSADCSLDGICFYAER